MQFENETFSDEVTLDGNEFVNCGFARGCKIIYGGGKFDLKDCRFQAPIAYELNGAAAITLSFLRFLARMSPDMLRQMLEENVGGTRPTEKGGKKTLIQ